MRKRVISPLFREPGKLRLLPGSLARSVYDQSYHFRIFLEQHRLPYVVAVPKNQSVCQGFNKIPANTLLPSILPNAWKTLSCGEGSKGPRLYQWVYLPLNSPDSIYQRWFLFRKGLKNPEDIAYFLVFAHPGTSLEDMVQAAGQRWKIEECFESAKGEVSLDQYEARNYQGWYCHITLAMLAHALLVTTKSQLFPSLQDFSSMAKFKKSVDSYKRQCAGDQALVSISFLVDSSP